MSSRRHSHSHHHHHHHHHGGGEAHDPPPAPNARLDNTLGAVLFYTYIVLALLFTTIIVRRLRRQARNLNIDPPSQQRQQTPSPHRTKLTLLTLLALLSFTALSYHMLHVLFQSYTAYSALHLRPISHLAAQHLTSGMLVVPAPSSVVAFFSAVAGQVWRWSLSSTLFVDFAEDLVRTREREGWSFAALVGSLAVAVWIAERGRREDGGGKGMVAGWYFALMQILPVGFTLWLFLLGVLLADGTASERNGASKNQSAKVDSRAYWVTGLLFASYALLLQTLPSYLGRSEFVPLVLAVRMLLGLPLFLPLLLRWTGVLRADETDSVALAPPASTLVGMVTTVVAIKLAHARYRGVGSYWAGLNSSPAVSALGYDFLIAVVGLILLWLAGGLPSSNGDSDGTENDGQLQRSVDAKLHEGPDGLVSRGGGTEAESTSLQQALDQRLRSRRE